MNTIKRYLKMEIPLGQSCFLWGARKIGKSTYLHLKFKDAIFVDLLNSEIFKQYLRNFKQLEDEILANPDKTIFIIDEIQRIPDLLNEIHRLIEIYKDKQFILCGSSIRKIRSSGANLLGGRAWRFIMLPLCYAELKELNWQKIFNNGLIPKHYLSSNNVYKDLSSYIFDYVLSEVQHEASLRKADHFARFLDVLGFCNGELINYTNIAADSGVSAKTIKTYFEILVDMYLGYYLHPYVSNPGREIISRTPKFYLFDVGIANYLKHYEYKSMIGEETGKAFEHYIFLELTAYKNYYDKFCDKREEIYFWRSKEGYEVDFILGGHAFEVKISIPISVKKHLKGLLEFSNTYQHKFKLHVIGLEPRRRVIKVDDREITIWPVKEFLEQMWNNNIF
ncbi:MAG: AAA family ATPase [Gammaproteobacteria bacterium]